MKAWEAYLKRLSSRLGPEIVTRWLTPLKIIRFDARNLYLEAGDSFQILWFKEHVGPHLKKEFLSSSGKPIQVHISVKGPKPADKQQLATPLPKITYDPITPNPKMTFENFLSLKDCLTKTILENPEPGLNPIYLYGPAGSGKTHLLNAFTQQTPGAFFVHAQNFTDHVVTAMRTSDMDAFRARYRSVKALIIDDVHIITKRTATQEELFHTFNALHTAGTQIVLSSHLPPSQLQHIEPRLISRFEWGITLSLTEASPFMLKQILQTKAEDFPLCEQTQNFLLSTFHTPKSLFEALEALMLRSHLEKLTLPLSLTQVEHLLKDLLQSQKKRAITPPAILKAVAENFEISTDDLLGKSQTRECSLPRKIAMYFFRQKLKMPYSKIGEHFSRDHSTVMTSCRDIAENFSQHKDCLATLENLLH